MVWFYLPLQGEWLLCKERKPEGRSLDFLKPSLIPPDRPPSIFDSPHLCLPLSCRLDFYHWDRVGSVSSSERLPGGFCLVEGFIPATFTARVRLSVTYFHFFHDGGTFGSLRSVPRLVPLRSMEGLNYTLLCYFFFWDFWREDAILGMGYAIYMQSLRAFQDTVYILYWG